MASTVASPGTSATPAPQPLTTPFVAAQTCSDQFTTTHLTTSFSSDHQNVNTTIKVMSSTPQDVSSCMPSGWDEDQYQFRYSPAVCPSGWTAYDLGVTATDVGSVPATVEVISTAFCCDSGFTYSTIFGIPTPEEWCTVCVQDLHTETGTEQLASSSITIPFPSGVRVHQAWPIAWESSDISTLRPTPPQLGTCSRVVLSSWVPGATVDLGELVCPSPTSEPHGDGGGSLGALLGLIIALPIGGCLILAVVLGCCCRRKFPPPADQQDRERLTESERWNRSRQRRTNNDVALAEIGPK